MSHQQPDPVWPEPGAPTTRRAVPSPDGGLAAVAERLREALTELEGVCARHERQVIAERVAERARVVAAWLPVLDRIERALELPRGDAGALAEGLAAARDEAVAVLAELGYPRHDETGVPFEPAAHEVVAVLPETDSDAPAGTVLHVVRPGYGDGEWRLRPAAVVVAGGPA
ncbi:molecular chaperone GrpE [Micromonospora pattaloongensis]|uniref:Molecular chaperone GrpE n=1 Tax=Micromonospora pattaloongensis TaxID=405436 RepID=A0A1H3RRR5_9ACTN|nr:nucleotide exchange factor GrpE [Micromonospora pattaloongensis]SDZ28396.1 molecular chaperone GrpE [Micromonospora pattaloongensis]